MREFFFRAGLLLALIAMVSAPRALAQPAGAAATDSLGRPIFGFLRPTYTSAYKITQNETAWEQGFAFRNQLGLVSLDSDTRYVVNTDPKRTNFKRTGGTTTNRFDYSLLNRVPLSLSISYDRKGTDDANDRQRQERLDSGLTATWRQRFSRVLDVNVNGGYSVTRANDTATFQGTVTGAREKGLNRNLGLIATLSPQRGMTLRLNSNQTLAKTRSRPVAESSSTADTGPRENTSTNHSVSGSWAIRDGLDLTADWQYRDLRDSYILVSRDTTLNNRVETQTNKGNSLATALHFKPPKSTTTEFGIDLSRRSDASLRSVEKERSSDRSSANVKFKARHMLLNTQLETNFTLDRAEDRSPSRPGSETIARTLDGTITRTLSEQTTVRVVSEIGLRSLRFDDGELDSDSQKKRVEAALMWKPGLRLQTSLSGRASRDNNVSIDSTQSRGSRLDESYGVNADIKLTVSSRTRLSQVYNFSALFSSFRFNHPSDNIQRTREVRTVISHQLLTKLGLELNHGFKYRETGGYRRDPTGGRIFAKGDDRYDQDLKMIVNYQATNWLSFRTEEWFHRDDSIRLATNARRTTSRIEFNQTASLRRPIPGGGDLTASGGLQVRKQVKPIAGLTESYFNATVSLTKPF